MKLPTEKSKLLMDPTRCRVLLYGPTKVGKTTWAAAAPDCLILATEPGCDALECYSQPIGTWAEMLEALSLVAGGKHGFKTICIDTVDNAYGMCQDHVCLTLGIKHPADVGYGKGFSAVTAEWRRVLLRLAALPHGMILVSHSRERDVESKTGSYSRIQPTLTESARQVTLATVDVCLYAEVTAERNAKGEITNTRVLRTKPTALYDAGDRTGRLPDPLPMDYAAFSAAMMDATKTTKTAKEQK